MTQLLSVSEYMSKFNRLLVKYNCFDPFVYLMSLQQHLSILLSIIKSIGDI